MAAPAHNEQGKKTTMALRTTGSALAVALFAAAVSGPALADEDEDSLIPGTFAGSVALTSDYRFRGISQTDKNAALQGSLEYSIDSGLYGITPYVGFWGSNVDFNDDDEATLEIDVLFGLRGEIGDTGLSYNLGGIYYAYPGADKSNGNHLNYDYWEVTGGLGYSPIDMITLNANYFYSPDFFGATGKAHYVQGVVTVTPPIEIHKDVGFNLFGSVGFQNVEDTKDYVDWSLGAAVTYKFLKFSVAYVDTNLTQADLAGNSLADAALVATLSASF